MPQQRYDDDGNPIGGAAGAAPTRFDDQGNPITEGPPEWQGPLTPREQLRQKLTTPDDTQRARAAETAWGDLNPVNLARQAWQGITGELEAGRNAMHEGRPVAGVAHTVASMVPILGPMVMNAPGRMADELEKALIARGKGDTTRAVGHTAAGLIPVAGPMAADIAEQAASGDTGGAAGHLVALGLGPKVYGAAAGPAGRVASGAAEKVAGAAERIGERAQMAAAGAKEGGIGGAVSSVIRNVAPIEPEALMMKAVRPRSSQVNFEAKLPAAMEEAKVSEQAMGKPITNFETLVEAIDLAKKRVRARYDEMAGPLREQGITLDLTPAADKMMAAIPETLRLENPAAAARIAKTADLYRRRVPLEAAEQYLKEANAQLESFYAKFPGSQRKALEASPEAAIPNARAQGLREAIYGELDRGTGEAGAVQRRYGSLMALEEEALRQLNVSKRLKEQSLAEQISTPRAYFDMVKGGVKALSGNPAGLADALGGYAMREASRFMKEQGTAEAMIRRAFEGYRPRRPADLPNVPQIERGAIVRPAAETSGITESPPWMPQSYPVSERRGLPPARTVHAVEGIPDTSGRTEPPSWMPKQYPLSPETVKTLSREDLISRLSGVQRTPGLAPEEAAQLMQVLRDEMRRRGISLVPIKGPVAPRTYTQRR
jgi:hypothetical protein